MLSNCPHPPAAESIFLNSILLMPIPDVFFLSATLQQGRAKIQLVRKQRQSESVMYYYLDQFLC